jgi:CheY-like chemotaxis protein
VGRLLRAPKGAAIRKTGLGEGNRSVPNRTDNALLSCYEGSSLPLADLMTLDQLRQPHILVVDDVEETRHGIERLLATAGYRVSAASNEKDAVVRAQMQSPDLILMSPGIDSVKIAEMGRRIRENSGLSGDVPVVIFCVGTLEEGAEAVVGYNIYMTRPDNFDQLRRLLSRLLRTENRTC